MKVEKNSFPAYTIEAAIVVYKDLSLTDTAAYFGVKPWRVRRDLIAAGVPMRKQGNQPIVDVPPRELITYLVEKHKSGRKAVPFRGVSRSTFQRWRNQKK